MTKANPNAIHLAPLDRAEIRATESAAVREQLAGITDPEALVAAANAIVNDVQGPVETLRRRRNTAALALAVHHGARALEKPLGISRTAWYETRKGKTARDVAFIPRDQAVADLPELAHNTAVLEERLRAALAARDEAALSLLDPDNGYDRHAIAAMIGRNPSRVSQIATQARKAQERQEVSA